MSVTYKYQLFNLLVESQFKISALEEAKETNKPIDVFIGLGKIPAIKGKILFEDTFSQLAHDEYCLKVAQVANYYVANGNYICVEPLQELSKGDIYLFLLGSVLGVLLAQREAVILHSSSVVIGNEAILFCGDCGVGKSTTATAFRLRGYPLLSDDINLLDLSKQHKVIAYKGFPQQKLYEDAMTNLGIDPTNYKKINYAKGKYIMNEFTCFDKPTVPVKAIFELQPKEEIHEIQISEYTGQSKLIGLMKNLFRLQVRYYTGTSSEYMKKLIQIAAGIPYFAVSRPKDTFCTNELIEKILLTCKKII